MDFARSIGPGIVLLLYYGAAALQTRANRRWLRVIGRVATLGPFGVFTIAFAAALAQLIAKPGDGWEDLVLVVFLIPFFLTVFPALYPLAAVRLRPRTAWIVPAAVCAVAAAASLAGLGAFRGPGSGKPLAALAALGVVAATGMITWLACFLGNPRCRPAPLPPDDGTPPADAA